MGCAQSTPNSSSSQQRLFRQLFGGASTDENEEDDDRRRGRGTLSQQEFQRQQRARQKATEEVLKTKVVLLGDSGVGKSCIVNRFATNTFDIDSRVTVGAAFVARTIEVSNGGEEEETEGNASRKNKKKSKEASATSVDGESSGGASKRKVKFEIWDTAGQERYESLANLYYRRAHVALVVFALDDEKSFEKARFWINELKEKCEKRDVLIILCGNKMDKITDEHEDRIVEPSSSSRRKEGEIMESEEEEKKDDNDDTMFVSMDRAERMANELGCHMCVTSSAKTGEGVEELFFGVARRLLRKQSQKGDGATIATKKKPKAKSNENREGSTLPPPPPRSEIQRNPDDDAAVPADAAKKKKKKKKKTMTKEDVSDNPTRRPLHDTS
jgi:small GTP-binding protein